MSPRPSSARRRSNSVGRAPAAPAISMGWRQNWAITAESEPIGKVLNLTGVLSAGLAASPNPQLIVVQSTRHAAANAVTPTLEDNVAFNTGAVTWTRRIVHRFNTNLDRMVVWTGVVTTPLPAGGEHYVTFMGDASSIDGTVGFFYLIGAGAYVGSTTLAGDNTGTDTITVSGMPAGTGPSFFLYQARGSGFWSPIAGDYPTVFGDNMYKAFAGGSGATTVNAYAQMSKTPLAAASALHGSVTNKKAGLGLQFDLAA